MFRNQWPIYMSTHTAHQGVPYMYIHYTVPVLVTTVFLKISPRVRNMYM